MNGGYFAPDWRAKVTVPVKPVGERQEFFDGGDVSVCEGTMAAFLRDLRAKADELAAHHSRQAKKK